MHGKEIVEKLLREHISLYDHLWKWETALRQATGGSYGQCYEALTLLRDLCGLMERELRPHFQEEEHILYAFAEYRFPRLRGLLSELRDEHESVRQAFEKFLQALSQFNASGRLGEVEWLGWDVVHLLRRHMAREERELHPVLRQEFKEEDWQELRRLYVDSKVA